MATLKRKRNNNSRKFVNEDEVFYQLHFNYKKYDSLDKDLLSNINDINSLIVNPVSKNSYKQSIDYINFVSKDKEQLFCGELLDQYVEYYLKKEGDLIIDLQLEDNTLIGYTVLEFKHDSKEIIAHLICGNKKYKNIGTLILEFLKKLGKKISYKRILLTSTTPALPFYLKNKFECVNEQCPLEYIIKHSSGGKRKTRKQKSFKHFL